MIYLNFLEYRREDAVAYALKWALTSNPHFYDYTNLGGDCTSFASQAILAGGSPMNYESMRGWYYINPNRKSPSWTGVNFLFDFLISNKGRGPFAELVSNPSQLQLGDIVQLSFQGGGVFNHSMVVIKMEPPYTPAHIYTATHTPNRINVRVAEYSWREIRFIHIKGSRN